MSEYLDEKLLSILLEEAQRFLSYLDLFSSLKEFYSAQVDPVQVDALGRVGALAKEKGLFVYSAQGLYDFFLSKVLEDADTWPDA